MNESGASLSPSASPVIVGIGEALYDVLPIGRRDQGRGCDACFFVSTIYPKLG
jgi:hypothetical protein